MSIQINSFLQIENSVINKILKIKTKLSNIPWQRPHIFCTHNNGWLWNCSLYKSTQLVL